jgi:hypothetical protein
MASDASRHSHTRTSRRRYGETLPRTADCRGSECWCCAFNGTKPAAGRHAIARLRAARRSLLTRAPSSSPPWRGRSTDSELRRLQLRARGLSALGQEARPHTWRLYGGGPCRRVAARSQLAVQLRRPLGLQARTRMSGRCMGRAPRAVALEARGTATSATGQACCASRLGACALALGRERRTAGRACSGSRACRRLVTSEPGFARRPRTATLTRALTRRRRRLRHSCCGRAASACEPVAGPTGATRRGERTNGGNSRGSHARCCRPGKRTSRPQHASAARRSGAHAAALA